MTWAPHRRRGLERPTGDRTGPRSSGPTRNSAAGRRSSASDVLREEVELRGRETIEEVHFAGSEVVDAADDGEAAFGDEALDDLGAVAELVHRGADVRADGGAHQRVGVRREVRLEQGLDRGTDAVDDRHQAARAGRGAALPGVQGRGGAAA